MNIGIVLPAVPGYSETFFRSKIEGLVANGFKVTLFVGNDTGNDNYICPVKVHPQLSKFILLKILQSIFILITVLFSAPKPVLKLFKLARRNGINFSQSLQLVIINSTILRQKLDWLHFGFATAAIKRELVGKAIGAKVAVSFRGFDISIYPIKNKNCYNLLWNFVDKAHAISMGLLEEAYKHGLQKDIPVFKIPPAISVTHFKEFPINKNGSEQFLFLSVARLHWIKGLEYTLEALAILKKEGKRFKYKIAGDGVEFERLRFAVHQLDLEDEVEFLGKVSHNCIRELMWDAQVYLQFSINEGFCNAVLEAQAAGMLCIVSDSEGLKENVLDSKTGWVVPKRCPNKLAQKISEVLEMSEEEKKNIISNAKKRVEREFNIEKQRQQFVEFYMNI